MADKKKMGRPTDEPKPHKVSARLTDEGFKILDDYCQKSKSTIQREFARLLTI